MKNFLEFLTEAGTSQASAQAQKLNLKSDGHGGWLDSRGNFVAKTEKGKLKFYNARERKAEEGPVKQMATARADDKLAGAPRQQPAPQQKAAAKPDPEASDLDKTLDTLTLAFGRFNPPTAGHEKLIQAAEKAAAGGDLKIYPSRTQDNKKNPIDPDMKVSYMRKMFPDYKDNIINDPKMRSIFDVLVAASEEGYKSVNIIVGSDRLGEFESLAMKYNGDLYNFDEIKTISAGPRDDEAEGVGGVSSSKQRKAVMDDDFAAFKRGLPKTVKDADAQALFDAVRTGMKQKKKGVEESYDLWEIAPKSDPRGLRDNYVKRKIFNIGDLVENLNTGLVGRIMRRGTNYLICVTEQDNMFKSWIHDVTEAVRPANKTGRYGVPSPQREVGTDAYREYAQSMVPGQEAIRNFINKYKAKK
tara:strand:+ start:577 stop:1821 length:1245 start_codon:yes stop_codon:yes gene_type:complete